QAALDLLTGLAPALGQPAFQLRRRRRQDEHEDRIRELLPHLPGALDVDVQHDDHALLQSASHALARRAVPPPVHRRPLEQLPGLDHAVEGRVVDEEVVSPVHLVLPPRPRRGRDREYDVSTTLDEGARQTRLSGAARRRDHQWKRSPQHPHSTFSICSRRRSISFLIEITRCWIVTSFAFEPIVFASRSISWLTKRRRLPTGSAASRARVSRNSAMCDCNRTSSSLMSHFSAR